MRLPASVGQPQQGLARGARQRRLLLRCERASSARSAAARWRLPLDVACTLADATQREHQRTQLSMRAHKADKTQDSRLQPLSCRCRPPRAPRPAPRTRPGGPSPTRPRRTPRRSSAATCSPRTAAGARPPRHRARARSGCRPAAAACLLPAAALPAARARAAAAAPPPLSARRRCRRRRGCRPQQLRRPQPKKEQQRRRHPQPAASPGPALCRARPAEAGLTCWLCATPRARGCAAAAVQQQAPPRWRPRCSPAARYSARQPRRGNRSHARGRGPRTAPPPAERNRASAAGSPGAAMAAASASRGPKCPRIRRHPPSTRPFLSSTQGPRSSPPPAHASTTRASAASALAARRDRGAAAARRWRRPRPSCSPPGMPSPRQCPRAPARLPAEPPARRGGACRRARGPQRQTTRGTWRRDGQRRGPAPRAAPPPAGRAAARCRPPSDIARDTPRRLCPAGSAGSCPSGRSYSKGRTSAGGWRQAARPGGNV